jgi:hypothetical protein
MTFSYRAVYQTEHRRPPPVGLIIRESSTGPDRLVIWSHRDQGWRFRPEMAARYLYDDQMNDQVELVDRTTAERIARENLGAELPSEEELHRINEEGLAARG